MARVITPSGDEVRTVYSSAGFAAGDYVFQTASGFEKAQGNTGWPIGANVMRGVYSNLNVTFSETSAADLLLGPSQTGGTYSGPAFTSGAQTIPATSAGLASSRIVRLTTGFYCRYSGGFGGSAFTVEILNPQLTAVVASTTYTPYVQSVKVMPMTDGSVAVGFYDNNNAGLRIISFRYSGGTYTALPTRQSDGNGFGGYAGYFNGASTMSAWITTAPGIVKCVTWENMSSGQLVYLGWNLYSGTGIYTTYGQQGQNNYGYVGNMQSSQVSSYFYLPSGMASNTQDKVFILGSSWFNSAGSSNINYFTDGDPNTSSCGSAANYSTVGPVNPVNFYSYGAPPSGGQMFLATGATYGVLGACVSLTSATNCYLQFFAWYPSNQIYCPGGNGYGSIPAQVNFTASGLGIPANQTTKVFAVGPYTTSNPTLAICYYTLTASNYYTPVMRLTNYPYTTIGPEIDLTQGVSPNTTSFYSVDGQTFQFCPYVGQIMTNFYTTTATYFSGTSILSLSSPQPFAYGNSLSPSQTGTCVGVALTAASAGGTGKILVRGTAEVRSTLPNMPGALSFNHANYGTPGGIRGSVAGRIVTFEGIDG